MLRIGLIGLGFMGNTHLENYLRLEQEGQEIQVVALCDMDPAKLQGPASAGNIETVAGAIDFGRFNKYTSVADMLAGEQLDAVDITLPTFLHEQIAVQCLNHGLHVLCEKPMALTAESCDNMIAAAEANGKQLMIGQCLRFWPAYVLLKEAIDNGDFGAVTNAYFFRGGATPTWGPWLLQKDKSGGALMDMHVHDADMVYWLFGMPQAVSAIGRNVVAGSGYDLVSAHYRFADGQVVNAQCDWTLQGDFGFDMTYRVNFEKGNIVFKDGAVKVNPNEGAGYVAELSADMGYYFQLKHFVEQLAAGKPIVTAAGRDTRGTIAIVGAELRSADEGGAWVELA
ncbi:Gfo/Idh/MocA family protein [Cohnella sp. GCM10027633]|uniref:Gfo/Idh/MocA family protein n=1 Tax=unclassified Cohnella TaxID=2636738 RepID=UPI003639DBFF